MAKAVFKIGDLTVGIGQLGARDNGHGQVDEEVHDGDTLNVDPVGNLGVRFLGVDAPEVSFTLPGGKTFVDIDDPRWEAFLSEPFADSFGDIDLLPSLHDHLKARVGSGAATNHAELAGEATQALRAEVSADMERLGQDSETFSFFLAFATEVMDGYGRFLAFINCNQEQSPRPDSYNERLLKQGNVTPYFIWPNLDPFRKQPYIVDAVPKPGGVVPAGSDAEASEPLDEARAWVRHARAEKLGVWRTTDPLRLLPFELRFLARRTPPDRWVIDLAAGDDRLLAPQLYHRIPHPEDRLFVPAEYVALFVSKGWKTTTN